MCAGHAATLSARVGWRQQFAEDERPLKPRRWPQSPPSHWSPHEDAVWVGALKRVAISHLRFEGQHDLEAGFRLASRGRHGPRSQSRRCGRGQ